MAVKIAHLYRGIWTSKRRCGWVIVFNRSSQSCFFFYTACEILCSKRQTEKTRFESTKSRKQIKFTRHAFWTTDTYTSSTYLRLRDFQVLFSMRGSFHVFKSCGKKQVTSGGWNFRVKTWRFHVSSTRTTSELFLWRFTPMAVKVFFAKKEFYWINFV